MASSSGTSMHFELCESLETLHTADVRGLAALEIPADGSGTAAPNAGAESKEEQHMDVDMSNGVGRVLLATSSRDKTAAVSVRESGGGGFTHLATLAGHTDYVVPICLFSAPERGPGAGYFKPGVAHAITGSRDTSVKVFEVSTGTETDSLGGHEYQVTGIAITRDGDIVSASLDKYVLLCGFTYIHTHTEDVIFLSLSSPESVLSCRSAHTQTQTRARKYEGCIAHVLV